MKSPTTGSFIDNIKYLSVATDLFAMIDAGLTTMNLAKIFFINRNDYKVQRAVRATRLVKANDKMLAIYLSLYAEAEMQKLLERDSVCLIEGDLPAFDKLKIINDEAYSEFKGMIFQIEESWNKEK